MNKHIINQGQRERGQREGRERAERGQREGSEREGRERAERAERGRGGRERAERRQRQGREGREREGAEKGQREGRECGERAEREGSTQTRKAHTCVHSAARSSTLSNLLLGDLFGAWTRSNSATGISAHLRLRLEASAPHRRCPGWALRHR